jgi:SAM-dependent methyltransferase
METVYAELAQRFERIRSGLDVGFGDEDVTNALRALRGGVWLSTGADKAFPYEDSQFEVVVVNGAAVSRDVVREVHRVLRPAGALVFSVPARTRDGKGYDLPAVYRLVREGFDILSVKRSPRWSFSRRPRTLTLFARKKTWRARVDFPGGVFAPFTSVEGR